MHFSLASLAFPLLLLLSACSNLPGDPAPVDSLPVNAKPGDRTPGAQASAESRLPQLIGSSWQVTRMGDGAISGRAPTLGFQDQNRSQGYAGCNRFFARYEAGGSQISFHNIGSTRMACDPERNELEQRYLRDLNQVQRLEIVSDTANEQRLRLLDAEGTLLLELQRLPAGRQP